MSKMMRISEQVAKELEDLSASTGKTKSALVQEAVQLYAREKFLKNANEALLKLRNNPRQWEEFQQELKEWDTPLLDGIGDEEL